MKFLSLRRTAGGIPFAFALLTSGCLPRNVIAASTESQNTAAMPSTGAMTPSSVPAFDRFVVVVLENTAYESAIAQPYFRRLIREGALLTNYHGVTHPSQPNYIAMIAADTLHVYLDTKQNLHATHLGDLLEAHGKTWKAYAEGYPGTASNCFLDMTYQRYVRRHVPFLSFVNIQSDPTRCARVVNADQFAIDLEAQNLPDFSFYSPDLDDDGHDTGVSVSDDWMNAKFRRFVESPKAANVTFLFTFDENDYSQMTGFRDRTENQVMAILHGNKVRPGSSSSKYYNHYSISRTLEDSWHLGSMNRNDRNANPVDDVFQ